MATTITARIETYEVQPNGNVRPSTLFKLFQKAAGDDIDKTGMTYDVLADNGIAFVQTKLILKYFDNIKVYDNIEITTHARENRGVAFIRDYAVYSCGKLVAYATSFWVLIDINSRRLCRPSVLDSLGSIPTDTDDLYELEDKRIKFDASHLKRTDVREVYYSHIDRNKHMNNTFYPDVLYDYLPDEYKDYDIGKTITICYNAEIMCGEKFEVYTHLNDSTSPPQFMFFAKNIDSGKDIFTALIDF